MNREITLAQLFEWKTRFTMVCADDTLLTSALDGGWVDISAVDTVQVMEQEETIPPLAMSDTEKSEDVVEDESSNMTVAERQKRQHEAQLAFLKQQGLIDDDNGDDKDDITTKNGVERVTTDDNIASPEKQDSTNKSGDMYTQVKNAARKAGVATAGGALVAVGAVLTPLPTPGGILLAGAGLGVLSTEFECAKKALNSGKSKLVDLIDSIPDEETEKEDDSEKEGVELTTKTSNDTEDDCSVVSSKSGISRTSSTVTQRSEVRASLQGQARRIGKSIRPFLTDEDAPRQAMETLNANTKRACSQASDRLLDASTKASNTLYDAGTKASGKLFDAVKFVLVLDEYDPNNLPQVTSPLASPQASFAESMHGPKTEGASVACTADQTPATTEDPSKPCAATTAEPEDSIKDKDTDEADSTADEVVVEESKNTQASS